MKPQKNYPHIAILTFIDPEEDTDYPDRGWVLQIRNHKDEIVLNTPTNILNFNCSGAVLRNACIAQASAFGFIPDPTYWTRNPEHGKTATFIINPPRSR